MYPIELTASRHTTAPISHTRPVSYNSFPVSLRVGRPSVVDWGGGMSAGCKPRVQLFADAGDGWPHSVLRKKC